MADATKPLLRVEQVGKTIKSQTLVRDISLELGAGRVLALCGGNGAGKSTLLRLVMGLLQPTSGHVEVDGLRWQQDRRAYADKLGYMPDDYTFARGLTAWETLQFWASLRGLPKSRTEEALVEVGLADMRDRKVTAFSKGMRQRLLFAQAMLAKPPLLVLDEPTNGLDPYWMDSFVELVRKLRSEGHSVLYSTHQLPVAEASADEVVFMREGSAVRQGSVAELLRQYGSGGLHAAFTDSRQAGGAAERGQT
ncbi:heme ABC exporter ATP-binding protein CcmA [Paenibacillus pasadenensis]|uniref:Nitrous oxide reductase maturation protein NosF (ATPase) n=1 Tax=Paenibacillus pasadenensis TaxID=217090 RepID=A0A2N5N9K0_9BACL|nr:heme ABC exporter ATP-binding protein CcmA [Paenibacillus pasadenensis]PLT47014.1 Nitrous oxide reductase maturation protein NosF (ATPase) [Paenibacillus pasadenensis]